MAKKQEVKKGSSRLVKLRGNLVQRRKDILAGTKKELHNIMGEDRERQADEIDEAVSRHQDHIVKSMLTSQNQLLKRIDEAIAKIDANTYGSCEECGEDIPAERLRVLPFAILCVSCQEEKENNEKRLVVFETDVSGI